jgi:predicted AlkP superfamily pyrophosphatase or phosphodiesterase
MIVVFDGLQPSQVKPELMPNLAKFASEGVFFNRHHPVFPTVTRVSAATLVTGRAPGGHGLAGNTLVARDFDGDRVLQAMQPNLAEMARADVPILFAPTLAEILSRYGKEYIALGVGTSGNAYVHNPTADTVGGATIHPEFTLPSSLNDQLISRFGEWPDEARPNTPRFAQGIRIMTEYILPERNPAVALIWSSEPDKSQHAAGVGSELANVAMGEADAKFGELLKWLDDNGNADGTDVIVLSDHGYVTITDRIDLDAELPAAGFDPDDVLIATNGGSALFYVNNSDREITDRLTQWLMAQPWCGALTASDAVGQIEGTLPNSLIGIEGARGPELAMSFRWDSRVNENGFPGFAYSTSGSAGLGQHGSMSKHELRNTGVARGPSFKSGITVDSPSGNIDIAPTILRILGHDGGESMEGRVLEEALADGSDSVETMSETHTAERKLEAGVFRQHITVSKVGDTVYVDEGNSEFVPN